MVVACLGVGLLVSQRDHGIDSGGTTRRYVARCKRDQCQKGGDGGKNRGIARFHFEKQAGHYAGQG